MRATCTPCLAGALLLAVPLIAQAAGDDASRFRVRAELRPVASSADGRFALSGEARVTPKPTSPDGRFALKSALASCDPLDFTLFRDGFEGL